MTIDEGIEKLEYCIEQLEMEIESGLWIKGSESELSCKEGIVLNKQYIEWLKELKEAKRILKSATTVLSMFLPCDEDYNCSECIKQRRNCDYDDSFKWRYLEEALALVGKDDEQKDKRGE